MEFGMSESEQTRNWRRANIARTFFHEGFVDFVSDLITDVYKRLVTPNIENSEDADAGVITQCDRGESKRCMCTKQGCQSIYDQVIDLHVCSLHSRIQNWHRCFCYNELAVAACFLTLHEPHERKSRSLQNLKDVDSLGLLTILENCSLESAKFFDGNLLIRAIDIHTNITRNANMETEREALLEFLDVLITILKQLDEQRYPESRTAIIKIQQLKEDDASVGQHAILLTPGKLYDPTKELGRGRSAVVYEGKSGCRGAMFPAAVKQIWYRDRDRDESLMRELSEARIMQVLEQKRHPNVVGYYELFQTETHLYIFTELYNGTLEDYVKDSYEHLRARFNSSHVNRCLAKGLNFLHSEGVVHRDLKPSNIFIRVNDGAITKVAIGDFGSAKLCRMKYEYSATQSCSNVPGTMGYVSPEVWDWYEAESEEDDKKTFTVKSDTFSLGLIYYFTVSTGKHPFGRGSGFKIQQKIQKGETPDLSLANHEYQSLIDHMIQMDIEKRMFTKDVLVHPALWTSEQILDYFKEKSNYLVDSKASDVDTLSTKLESLDIIGPIGWLANLPPVLADHLSAKQRMTRDKEHSVLALLRTIRNTEHHIADYPELAGGADYRVDVWKKACPGLLMGVYGVFKESNTDSS